MRRRHVLETAFAVEPGLTKARLIRGRSLMPRYFASVDAVCLDEPPFFGYRAEVTDSVARTVPRGPKWFVFERRAKRWAIDERHLLETEAWQRYMEVFCRRAPSEPIDDPPSDPLRDSGHWAMGENRG